MDKAVILARGLGTRMQKTDEDAGISAEQSKVANIGVKAMIPIDRPFLDYVISCLADAGYKKVCLVIGPEHGVVREYYEQLETTRVTVDFAIQDEPLGTADAVAVAEEFADGDDICVLNSDNYYPAEALEALRNLDGPGLIGYERQALIDKSNIEPDRIAKFAIIRTTADGYLEKIIEKPSATDVQSVAGKVCMSMNCWRFDSAIFRACNAIEKSPRGEFELTDAVQYTIDKLGRRFRVVEMALGVLDMTSRKDIASVAARLAGVEVVL